jgi:glucose/arabinose dehydrogenase
MVETTAMTRGEAKMNLSIRKLTAIVFLLASGFFVLITAAPVRAQQAEVFETSAGPVEATVVATGLSHPWAVAFLPDHRLLVTERTGRLSIIGENGKPGTPIGGVPEVWASGQGGLLDVVLSPDFVESGRIYLTYSEPGEGGAGTAVMSARLLIEGGIGWLEEQKVIFRMNRFTGTGHHFGSRIVIGNDGNLWVTLGDRGEMDRAQDAFDLAGGVIRITPEGGIPVDNPFADGKAGDPAFWSIGHRNPQGATLAPDGSLWTVEHGAQGGDEINKPAAGLNYGWPVITYGVNYNGRSIGIGQAAEGYEQPVYYWDPSIAPSGLDFYEGALFPEWQGDLLVGALKFQLLVRLDMEDGQIVGEERLFEGEFGRIRDVRVGPDGAIYLATDENDGKVMRIAPVR